VKSKYPIPLYHGGNEERDTKKEYLVGKAPEALLEQKITFDDDELPSVKFLGLRE